MDYQVCITVLKDCAYPLAHTKMFRIEQGASLAAAELPHIPVQTQIDGKGYANSPSKPSISTKTHTSSKTMLDHLNVVCVLQFTKMMVLISLTRKAVNIRPTLHGALQENRRKEGHKMSTCWALIWGYKCGGMS
jgi:hypothetical protein